MTFLDGVFARDLLLILELEIFSALLLRLSHGVKSVLIAWSILVKLAVFGGFKWLDWPSLFSKFLLMCKIFSSSSSLAFIMLFFSYKIMRFLGDL